MNGHDPNFKWFPCPACESAGRKIIGVTINGRSQDIMWSQCIWCGGSGAVDANTVEQFMAATTELSYKLRAAHNN